MPEVVYYKDASEGRLWRYRIVADNHEIVHASHKGWSNIADARIHLWSEAMALYFLSEPFKDPDAFDEDHSIVVSGPDVFFEMTKTSDEWRWKIEISQAVDTHLSHSHEGFKNQADCVGNAKLIGEILWDEYDEVVSDE